MDIRGLFVAGSLTALIDGLFSSVLAQFFYGSSVEKLFQGVASTLLGPEAMNGGATTALLGVLMHIGVAFGWSAVFLLLYRRVAAIRRAPRAAVAAIYGPSIWLVMSLIVIPALRHAPPNFNIRWVIQLVGHFPFVGLPIVWGISGSAREAVYNPQAR